MSKRVLDTAIMRRWQVRPNTRASLECSDADATQVGGILQVALYTLSQKTPSHIQCKRQTAKSLNDFSDGLRFIWSARAPVARQQCPTVRFGERFEFDYPAKRIVLVTAGCYDRKTMRALGVPGAIFGDAQARG